MHEEDLVVNQLSTFDLQPKDISHVFISHFHADHIASLPDLSLVPFRLHAPRLWSDFANLPPSEDMKHAFLRGLIPSDFDSRSQEVDMSKSILLSEEYAPFKTGYDLLGDESIIGVELPGHAHGQMGLFARDENGQTLFLRGRCGMAETIHRRESSAAQGCQFPFP